MLACSVRPVGSGQKNFQTKAIFASQSETLVIDYHAKGLCFVLTNHGHLN